MQASLMVSQRGNSATNDIVRSWWILVLRQILEFDLGDLSIKNWYVSVRPNYTDGSLLVNSALNSTY